MSKRSFDLTGLPMRWPEDSTPWRVYLNDYGEMQIDSCHRAIFRVTRQDDRTMFLRFADAVAAAAKEVRKRTGEEKKA